MKPRIKYYSNGGMIMNARSSRINSGEAISTYGTVQIYDY